MKRNMLYVFMLIAFLFFYGCAKPAAEVNGEKISMKTYKMVLNEKINQHAMRDADIGEAKLKDSVIQQLVGEKLILQAARENNVTVSDDEVNEKYNSLLDTFGKDDFLKQLQKKGIAENEYKGRMKDRLILDQYIASLIPDDSIKEDEIKEFYKNSPKPFINPEKVEVRLVQTQSEDEAKAILKEMKDNKLSFDEIADNLKKEGKAIVSDYGWVQPVFFSEEISGALRTLKKGASGGPYKAREGYYLLRVKDRKAESPKTYDEAKSEIKMFMLNQKRQAMFVHLIAERKKKASIKIFVD